MWKNKLFFGDNLRMLREHIDDESVDLVYLDPPFNSNANYNVLFKEKSGQQSHAQITAFEDTWEWGPEAEDTYFETVQNGGKIADFLQAFRGLLGTSDMMAYLVMMAPRLQQLHRVLKPTGSIYLHCDPTASHYLKLLMDAIFEPEDFRNEIIWKRTSGRKGVSQYGRVHEVILFYSKSDEMVWNPPSTPQDENNVRGHDIMKDADGRAFRVSDFRGAGQGPERTFGDKTHITTKRTALDV
jgi:adenine specific DNA methylase Mod